MATNILGSAKTFTEYPVLTMAHKHQHLEADSGIQSTLSKAHGDSMGGVCHISAGSWLVAGGESEHHGSSSEVILFREG